MQCDFMWFHTSNTVYRRKWHIRKQAFQGYMAWCDDVEWAELNAFYNVWQKLNMKLIFFLHFNHLPSHSVMTYMDHLSLNMYIPLCNDWHSIQDVFSPHAWGSWDRLWIHNNPDKNKALMKMNRVHWLMTAYILTRLLALSWSKKNKRTQWQPFHIILSNSFSTALS